MAFHTSFFAQPLTPECIPTRMRDRSETNLAALMMVCMACVHGVCAHAQVLYEFPELFNSDIYTAGEAILFFKVRALPMIERHVHDWACLQCT
jgi:uncharacterized membrane protein